MPLLERHAPTYHDNATKASSVATVGKQEILRRFPWVGEALYRAASRAFPVAITRSWLDRSTELTEDPLLRQVLPNAEELLAVEGDIPDPVGDHAKSPVPWLVQKHPDRALLITTKRCHVYCRFCFRRDHKPGERLDPTKKEMARAIHAARESGARELILSGGDPLSLSNSQLEDLLRMAREHFKVVRIHTRAPISAPERVDLGLLELLESYGPIWIVLHANHPKELSTDACDAIRRLRNAGATLLNQSVLLAGVNDHADTLCELMEQLVENGVFPYYLHHTDPVPGNSHFRVTAKTGIALHEEIRGRLSGVALPKYVVDLPDGSGKIPVDKAHRMGLIS